MNEIMDLRLQQIYEAMGDTLTPDINSVPVRAFTGPGIVGVEINFRDGMTDAKLRNYIDGCIDKIAQIKDHLKEWCKLHNLTANIDDGENLINTNREVGIIHDLWNTNKHFKLNRPSRSRLDPQIGEVNRSMRVKVSGDQKRMAVFLNPQTLKLDTVGDGTTDIVVDAQILDGQGKSLGMFLDIAEKAIVEWEKLLTAAGVVLPPRPKK